MENDLFILGDINIDILDNANNILEKTIWVKESLILVLFLKYMHKFGCLRQLIKHPAMKRCHTWILIDNIITNCEEKVTPSGVINTSLSDGQFIFWTRKIKRVNTNNHKQISFRTLKNNAMKNFERELKKHCLSKLRKV